MKTYPTLYARTATGAIQVWWMEQDGDKFRSISGQKNGAMVTADWTVATPKNVGRANATTAEEQAEAEVKAKYKKQTDWGGYWENESDIDKERFFQVMLAKSYKDYKHRIDWGQGVAVQIKYNGERMLAKRDGIWSRKGKKIVSIPHIEAALAPLFAKFPDAVVDGEGFNYDKRERLNEIHSIISKKTPTAKELAISKDLIRFYVYDGYGYPAGKGEQPVEDDADYLVRKAAIDNAFFAPCFKARYTDIIGYVPTWVCHSEAEVHKIFLDQLADKQEGVIVRILGEGYHQGRTSALLKYKPLDDAEYRIVSVQEGVGKFAGRIATFTCENINRHPFKDGTTTFDATFKGKEADAIKAWPVEAQKMVGKKATILFNGLTAYGKPNYPRLDWYNWDKS